LDKPGEKGKVRQKPKNLRVYDNVGRNDGLRAYRKGDVGANV